MTFENPYVPGIPITPAVLQRMEADVVLDAEGRHDASPHYWITRGELRAMVLDLVKEVRRLNECNDL